MALDEGAHFLAVRRRGVVAGAMGRELQFRVSLKFRTLNHFNRFIDFARREFDGVVVDVGLWRFFSQGEEPRDEGLRVVVGAVDVLQAPPNFVLARKDGGEVGSWIGDSRNSKRC